MASPFFAAFLPSVMQGITEGLGRQPRAQFEAQKAALELALLREAQAEQQQRAKRPQLLTAYHGVPLLYDPTTRRATWELPPPEVRQVAARGPSSEAAIISGFLAAGRPDLAEQYMTLVHPERSAHAGLYGAQATTEGSKQQFFGARTAQEQARRDTELQRAKLVEEQIKALHDRAADAHRRAQEELQVVQKRAQELQARINLLNAKGRALDEEGQREAKKLDEEVKVLRAKAQQLEQDAAREQAVAAYWRDRQRLTTAQVQELEAQAEKERKHARLYGEQAETEAQRRRKLLDELDAKIDLLKARAGSVQDLTQARVEYQQVARALLGLRTVESAERAETLRQLRPLRKKLLSALTEAAQRNAPGLVTEREATGPLGPTIIRTQKLTPEQLAQREQMRQEARQFFQELEQQHPKWTLFGQAFGVDKEAVKEAVAEHVMELLETDPAKGLIVEEEARRAGYLD